MIKLKDILTEIISQSQLDSIESYLDKLFAAIGIDVEFTRHFLDRANDVRNRKQIEPEELEDLFAKTYRDYGHDITKLGPDAEAVIMDMESNINVPFVLKYNPSTKKLDLISKTVMRKQGFQTSNKKLAV
jgi:Asp-tRNA(Asn)/Glu-tRNA(Gln) amidotransferase C subunit